MKILITHFHNLIKIRHQIYIMLHKTQNHLTLKENVNFRYFFFNFSIFDNQKA